jgi:hypothetical protein
MAQVKCPNCSRPFVRRVSIVGSAETLLGIFFVYPFRCQLCGVRFRMPQWGVRYVRVPEDKREYDRLPTSFPLTFHANNMTGQGAALEISMGGCSFNSTMQLASGTVLQMELHVADAVNPIVVDAAVVRYTHERSIGVEFLQWQESERDRLQLFVRGLLIGRGD